MTPGPLFVRGRLPRLAASLAVAACLSGRALAERPNAPRLLPDTTALLLWVPNAPETAERFMNTALGRMAQDPQLKPLVDHLYGSLATAVANAKERIGISLPELLAIPQGELAVAIVAPDEGPPDLVVLMDVGDQLSNARKLLERLSAELVRSGAKKSEQTIGDTKLAVFDGVGPRQRRLILVEKDSTVVVGSNVDVLKQVLSQWNGKGSEASTLGHHAKFASIMRRSGSAEQKPHVVWYADPIALMRSIGQNNAGVRLAVAMLPVLGLDGVKTLGGSVTFDAGQYDSIVYWHLLLDSPRTGVLKMIAPKSGDTEPERWVPADVANYTTLHWDFDTTFHELVSLFDGFRGAGAFADLLQKRIKEPIGLDVEKDLLPALAGRVTHFTRIERPITQRSQTTAVALQLKDPKAFGEVLEKTFKKNEAFLARRPYSGQEYFQLTPPGLTEKTEGPPRPIPCFGLVDDYLVFTDRPSLLEKVIQTSQGLSESLADSLDFKLVAGKIRSQSGGVEPAMIGFERPEEGMRMMYELAGSDEVRQGMRRESKNNPFLRSLNTALDENPLPPFAVIEQYLAPSGALLVDNESGLHYIAFGLRRKTE
jgi:hypothetical protein